MLGWLICKVKGKHRRGVRYEDRTTRNASELPGMPSEVVIHWPTTKFRCPRCGATWERKTRAAS